MRRALALTLTVALVIVVGCSSPSASAQVSAAASAQAGSEAVVCAGLAALQSSVDDLKSLDPATTSKQEYEQAVLTVYGTWAVVSDTLPILARANADLLSAAWENLASAFRAQPSDAPVASSAATVKPEAEALAKAVEQVTGELECT